MSDEPGRGSDLRRAAEVLWRFFLLGLTSFGGPTAHVGYFHTTFVRRLQWIEERSFAATMALCQFLPGPGSSQVGFAIGLHRAGLLGGLAAFVGFTTPSFLLMLGLASLDAATTDTVWFQGAVKGLKILAVGVVAHAVLGMAEQFVRGTVTGLVVAAAAGAVVLLPGVGSQMAVLGLAALVGALLLRQASDDAKQAGEATPGESGAASGGWWPLVLFGGLLLLPLTPLANPLLELFATFVRVGSLVFGGGHVVLPLLQASLESVEAERFLVGYAAAQGVPGPMFTMATYLGAEARQATPLAGALVATLGIFLPGFLLVLGLRDRWLGLLRLPALAGAFDALNAAVVGLLLAAMVPVWSSAVVSVTDGLLALGAFLALRVGKVGVVWLVVAALLVGMGVALL